MTDLTNKTRFFNQLKSFGLRRFIISPDFIIAVTVFIFMLIDQHYNLGIFLRSNKDYIIAIFAAASTLFAITLAALAIILSFSNSEFMKFLREKGRLHHLLFLFWVGNSAYLLVIFLSLICLLFDSASSSVLYKIIYPLIVSAFVYALIDSFYLLGTVVRFGFFLDIFEQLKNKHNNDQQDK